MTEKDWHTKLMDEALVRREQASKELDHKDCVEINENGHTVFLRDCPHHGIIKGSNLNWQAVLGAPKS